MLKKSNNNYYSKMLDLTKKIFDKYELIGFIKYNDENDKSLLQEIYVEKLYNILLDILNQVIYDKINEFSSDEVDFMITFEIDKILPDIIRMIDESINIKKIKNKLEKEQKTKNKKQIY